MKLIHFQTSNYSDSLKLKKDKKYVLAESEFISSTVLLVVVIVVVFIIPRPHMDYLVIL